MNVSGNSKNKSLSFESNTTLKAADCFKSLNFFSTEDPTLFEIVTFISLIGFIGNIITIIKITKDSSLNRPVFLILRCLSVADILSLTVRYFVQFTQLQRILACQRFSDSKLYDFLLYVTQHTSVYHIVLLTGYRMYMVRRPLRCQQVITNRKINLASLFIWIFSLIVAVIFTIPKVVGDSKRANIELVYTGYTLLIPSTLILLFHLIKLKRLNHNEDSESDFPLRHNSLPRSTRRQMTVIVSIIIVFYTIPCVLELIWFSLSLQYQNTKDPAKEKLINTVSAVSSIFWLINYAINPLIYFFCSRHVRSLICPRCFPRRRLTVSR